MTYPRALTPEPLPPDGLEPDALERYRREVLALSPDAPALAAHLRVLIEQATTALSRRIQAGEVADDDLIATIRSAAVVERLLAAPAGLTGGAVLTYEGMIRRLTAATTPPDP